MNKYLLDTHVLLWMQEDASLLPEKVQKIIADRNNQIYVSLISFWEIVLKQNVGKLKLRYDLDELAEACIYNNIETINIQFYHLNQLRLLPLLHKDPFDRLLVATAYSEGLKFISKDSLMNAYNIEVIW